jgi:hypothetical protein
LLMNFLIIHTAVFGKFWLKMCLFVVCRNYFNIIHLILHIAFHLHNCIAFFSFLFSIAYKCVGWFSNRCNIILFWQIWVLKRS